VAAVPTGCEQRVSYSISIDGGCLKSWLAALGSEGPGHQVKLSLQACYHRPVQGVVLHIVASG
jgi:hypothetical protein